MQPRERFDNRSREFSAAGDRQSRLQFSTHADDGALQIEDPLRRAKAHAHLSERLEGRRCGRRRCGLQRSARQVSCPDVRRFSSKQPTFLTTT